MKEKKANKIEYEEIKIGSKFGFKKMITQKDVLNFAELTGDYNPLHIDNDYARHTDFKGTIVHGMLAGSLFSTLVGMYCPGEKNLYLTQSLNFKKPLRPESEIIVEGEILDKIDSLKIVVIKTKIITGQEIIIEGEAKVKII